MENFEQFEPSSQDPKSKLTDDVKAFYKGDFKFIFNSFFKNPIDGIYSLFENPSEKAYLHSLILFASVFVLYLVGGYVIVGEYSKYLKLSQFIKISFVPVIMMLVISSLSFAIKSFSGKPNFKNELLTGGLCGIPLGLLIPVVLIIKIMVSKENIMQLIMNPKGAGTISILLYFYLILMMINVFQQSLKSSGTKDAIAWYISPASIFLAFYITYKIVDNILF